METDFDKEFERLKRKGKIFWHETRDDFEGVEENGSFLLRKKKLSDEKSLKEIKKTIR